jgi:hypothetical protein
MKTLLLATAAVCAAVAATPSHAVDVRYYGADISFAQEIGRCYEAAPAALKARTFNAQLIVVKSGKELAAQQRRTNAPASDIKKFSDGNLVAVTYKGFPRANQPRTMMFIQDRMREDPDDLHCSTVVHEMMHLFDGHPNLGSNKYLSDDPVFVSAFKADKAAYEAWLGRIAPDQQAQLKRRVGYFFTAPVEAYAEAGARMILPLPERYSGLTGDFNNAFPRVNAYMKNVLGAAGIYVVADLPPKKVEKKEPVVGTTWQSPEVKAISDQKKLENSVSSSELEGVVKWCIALEYKPEQCDKLPREYAKQAWCEIKGRKGDKPLTCLVEE